MDGIPRNVFTKTPPKIILAIVGSREFHQGGDLFTRGICDVLEQWGLPQKVVSGGARGADTLAAQWARANHLPLQEFRVTSEDWKKWGKGAGIRRNADIIEAATHVLAFPSRFGSGTQNSIQRAKRRGLPIVIYFID